MDVRSIEKNEVELFARLGHPTGLADPALAERLIRLWNDGGSAPSWCFMAEENGKPLARLGYWAFPSTPLNIKLFGFHVEWDRPDYLAIGSELLTSSLETMKRNGARYFEIQMYSDSTTNIKERQEILEAAGIPMVQEKCRFTLKKSRNTFKPSPQRLTYRSMEETGAPTFISAIERVTQGTLDRLDQQQIAQVGIQEAARDYYDILVDLHDFPRWWKLGYTDGGELAGLVVPQELEPGLGAINYIGVVPEFRGQGYVSDLLTEGTGILLDNGINLVIGDTDTHNEPMKKALARAGYEHTAKIWWYHKKL